MRFRRSGRSSLGEAVRARGADYLLVPDHDRWLLDDYPEFGRHVRATYRIVSPDEACVIIDLAPGDRRSSNNSTDNQ